MLTPLCWKALDNCAKVFSYVWSGPLLWNATPPCLIHNTMSKDMLKWAAVQLLNFLILLLPFHIIIFSKLFGHSDIPAAHVFIATALVPFLNAMFAINIYTVFSGADTVRGFNNLLTMARRAQSVKGKKMS